MSGKASPRPAVLPAVLQVERQVQLSHRELVHRRVHISRSGDLQLHIELGFHAQQVQGQIHIHRLAGLQRARVQGKFPGDVAHLVAVFPPVNGGVRHAQPGDLDALAGGFCRAWT